MSDIKEEVLTVAGIERNGCNKNGNATYKVFLYLPWGFTIAGCNINLENLPYDQKVGGWSKPEKKLVRYQIFKNEVVKVYSVKKLPYNPSSFADLELRLNLLKDNTRYLTDFYFYDLMNNKKITHKLYTDIVKQINNGISRNLAAIKL
jgi:hypothetical protein